MTIKWSAFSDQHPRPHPQPELSEELRTSVNAIKEELGDGRIVERPRQTGKTTALLEFLHEYCVGFAYVIQCTGPNAQHFHRTYRQRYPADEVPIVMSITNLLAPHGAPRVWLTDEVWPETVTREQPEFSYLEYLGGVGTPMCMDIHSR